MKFMKNCVSLAKWLKSVILALGRQREKDQEFKVILSQDSLGYICPYLKRKSKEPLLLQELSLFNTWPLDRIDQ